MRAESIRLAQNAGESWAPAMTIEAIQLFCYEVTMLAISKFTEYLSERVDN